MIIDLYAVGSKDYDVATIASLTCGGLVSLASGMMETLTQQKLLTLEAQRYSLTDVCELSVRLVQAGLSAR